MSTQTILPIDRQSVVELSRSKQEPEWMTALRTEALELAGSLELPSLTKTPIERWNLKFDGGYKAALPVDQPDRLPEKVRNLLDDAIHPENVLVHYNSGVVYNSLSPELSAKGVVFTDLETALREHPELVKKYFMTCINKEENLVTALHAALWSGGVFLYVPKNVDVDAPIQALFYADDPTTRFVPHVLIVADDNSSVTFAEHYVSGDMDGGMVLNGIVEVIVKSGASVHFATTHHFQPSVTDLTYRRAHVENDGRIHWLIGEMNLGNSMSETTSKLIGNGASSNMKVISVGTGEQMMNITTKAVHIGKATESEMTTRAVMRDQATAIINGITKIEKGATGSNGEQAEKVLMLSPRARGDANPILLIDEDDVKAGHAASVGQVSEEHIYYLMSRGISREQATKLIIYGFLAPVVAEIPISRMQEQLQALVERKLGQ